MKTETLKYIETCANERENASVQRPSCADVRQLLSERNELLEALRDMVDLCSTIEHGQNSAIFERAQQSISRATSQP